MKKRVINRSLIEPRELTKRIAKDAARIKEAVFYKYWIDTSDFSQILPTLSAIIQIETGVQSSLVEPEKIARNCLIRNNEEVVLSIIREFAELANLYPLTFNSLKI